MNEIEKEDLYQWEEQEQEEEKETIKYKGQVPTFNE